MIFRFSAAFSPLSLMLLLCAAPVAKAQDAPTQAPAQSSTETSASAPTTEVSTQAEAPPTPNADAANAESATTSVETASTETVSTETTVAPSVATMPIEYSNGGGRLTADVVRFVGGVFIAESSGNKGVVFQTADTRVQAERIEIDSINKTLRAQGQVFIERQRIVTRKPLVAKSIEERGVFPGKPENVTETLRGQNFQYDFNKKIGSLDKAVLELDGFSVTTDALTINGQRYTARDVVLFPGGQSEAERKKYGTPPFSLRAREVVVETVSSRAATAPTKTSDVFNSGAVSPQVGRSSTRSRARVAVRGGALYLGKTRLLPVPSYVFNQLNNAPRDPQAFSITPRISSNSTDGFLLTTQIGLGLSKNPDGAALTADLGLSQRVGFRGGVSVAAPTKVGTFSIGLRRNDIVSSQINNNILLNRTPEIGYASGLRPLFTLPGGRVAGVSFSANAGRYDERARGGGFRTEANRVSGSVLFTTRGAAVSGPYLDVFLRTSRYSNRDDGYNNAGFELGYAGQIIPKVRGAVSYRATSVSGQTPFRFDLVEIRRELRTTFDIEVTPRYLIPIDLRYDLDQKKLRDQSYGLLRSYKDFAYGLVYQSSRKEVRVEVRQGF